MKKYVAVSFVVGVFMGIFGMIYLDRGDYFGKGINMQVSGKYLELDAYGVLEPTNFTRVKNFRQLFLFSSIDGQSGKILMTEGLGGGDTIVFGKPKFLDILSIENNRVVAKNDIWTITITKDNISFVDKDGKSGELISDFLGK